MGMTYRAVVFDLDGTLLDTLEDIGNSGNRVLAGRNLPTHPLGRYRELIGEGVVSLVQRMLPEANRDEATVNACVEAYRGEYARNWNDKTKPYAGVPEMLDRLVELGLKMAVLSNKPDLFTQRCVRELLPRWEFGVVLGATEAFPRKPHPASAQETARRLGAQCEACLYVGDSGVDMQTAQAAGMSAVGVLWGFRDREELEGAGARWLIKEPGELPGLVGTV
jgi:phosphoglycolate phosphatase